jgi:Popeye protein conserved region
MRVLDFVTMNLVHVAAVFTLLSFFFRDQIKLRIFAAIGDSVASIYYFTAFPTPLWNSMVWTILNVCINTAMIILIFRDSREGGMSDDEMSLFRNLDTLTPGQFRKLVKLGKWHRPEDVVTLTKDGEDLDRLFYVLGGKVTIAKAKRKLSVEPKLFIGELAFLRKRPATATVTVPTGALYVSWEHAALEKLFLRDEDLRTAMHLLLGRDVAEKMANN